MRRLLTFVFCISLVSGFCQSHTGVSLQASAHLHFGANGLGANDAGAGLAFGAAFFIKHTLHALAETTADYFFGDKTYYTDVTGKELKGPVLYSLKFGPQYAVSKNLALSATFGPTLHRIYQAAFTTGYGFRFGAMERIGKQHNILVKAAATTVSRVEAPVHYFSFGVGYCFL